LASNAIRKRGKGRGRERHGYIGRTGWSGKKYKVRKVRRKNSDFSGSTKGCVMTKRGGKKEQRELRGENVGRLCLNGQKKSHRKERRNAPETFVNCEEKKEKKSHNRLSYLVANFKNARRRTLNTRVIRDRKLQRGKRGN